MEEELAWRAPETIPNELGLEIQVLLKNDAVVLARVAREERYGTHYLRFCDGGSELSISTVKGWRPPTLPITVTPVTGRLPLERWLEEGKALVAALPLQEVELREKYLKTIELLAKIRDRLTSYEGDVNLLTLMGEITAMVVRPEEAKDTVANQRSNVRGIVAKAKELEQERKRASKLHAQLVACGAAARGDQGDAQTPITNEEWSPVYQAVADLRKKYTQVCEAKAVGDAALQKAQQDNAAVRERLRQVSKERDRYVEERNALVDALLSATGEKNPGSLQGWLSLLAKPTPEPPKPAGWVVRDDDLNDRRPFNGRLGWHATVAEAGPFETRTEAEAVAKRAVHVHVVPVNAAGNVIEALPGVAWEAARAGEEAERLRGELAAVKAERDKVLANAATLDASLRRLRADRDAFKARAETLECERDSLREHLAAARTELAAVKAERDAALAEMQWQVRPAHIAVSTDGSSIEAEHVPSGVKVRGGSRSEVLYRCQEERAAKAEIERDAILAALAALKGETK